jgi:hypothetical protein
MVIVAEDRSGLVTNKFMLSIGTSRTDHLV